MWLIITLTALALANPCLTEVAPDTDLVMRTPQGASRTWVTVMVHASPSEQIPTTMLLSKLDSRGLSGAVVIDLFRADAKDYRDWIPALVTAGHEVVLKTSPNEEPDLISLLRGQAKQVKKWTGVRPRALFGRISVGNLEAYLARGGFWTLVDENSPPTGTARHSKRLEGQPALGVVLPGGPYDGACGSNPMAGPFTPAVADRATAAIRQATRSPHTSFVRVPLQASSSYTAASAVLARWLDETMQPSDAHIVTPSEARAAARQSFRTEYPANGTPTDLHIGKQIPVPQVLASAEALRHTTRLPRSIPPDLNPTELFLGLLLVLVDETEGPSVRMVPLEGPKTLATSTLDGPTPMTRDAILEVARALYTTLPSKIPAALPVGDRLLTAAELLMLFASAVRNDAPPTTAPTDVPEPNEEGLGWGSTR